MCFIDTKHEHARQGMAFPDKVPEFQRFRTFALLP